jgi:tRNA(Ile)-lysidine synthase
VLVDQSGQHPFGSAGGPLSAFARGVLDSARRRRLLGKADRVLVALSGGADSTALVAALAELRDRRLVAAVCALHVDHRLRTGGPAEAAACAEVCARLGVPFESVAVAVGPGNVQAEARRARYAALADAAARTGATRVATGHTRSDQAETVLLRLLRGAGARGLGAIPPRRGAVVRPLIDRSRAEARAYLLERGLPHLEDPTNATPRYLRNRLRAEVVPRLEALAPHAERALARAADLLRSDERALDRRARPLVDGATASREALLAEPPAVRRRAVRRLWRRAAGSARGLEAGHVEAVLHLLRRRAPGRVALPRGLEARLAGDRLEIGRPRAASAPPPPSEIAGPGLYPLAGHGVLEVRAPPDGAVAWPLRVRGRRPGDRFRPEGGRGSKKLKAWLIDRKVPREARDRLVVVADAVGRVLLLPSLGARAEGAGAFLALRPGE